MVSTLNREESPRLTSVGVVTCVFVETAGIATAGDVAHETLVRAGASAVWRTASGLVGAFRRVTDALHAALEAGSEAGTRIAVSTGETGARGECGAIAEKAVSLLAGAAPGATVLSRLTGALAMDHLPPGRALVERTDEFESGYELRTA